MTCQTSLAPNLRESIRCFSIINSHLNWCFQTNNKLTPGLKIPHQFTDPIPIKWRNHPWKFWKPRVLLPLFPTEFTKLISNLPPSHFASPSLQSPLFLLSTQNSYGITVFHVNQPFVVMHWFTGLSRCGKSCRLQWLNYLQPDVKWGNYTEEEELMIIKLHEELGNKYRDLNLY